MTVVAIVAKAGAMHVVASVAASATAARGLKRAARFMTAIAGRLQVGAC